MAKAELGTKRLCGSCGAKFYDLNKDPIACPKCGTIFVIAAAAVARARPEAVASASARPVAAEETEAPETADAEFVPLEEADAAAQGKKGSDVAADSDEDIGMDEGLDDAAFIQEEEEDSEDVTGIIRDVDNEEET